MRKLHLLIALMLCAPLFSQTNTTPALPKKLIRISSPKMAVEEEGPNLVLLKMEFNGAVPKSKLSTVKVENIATITLVYSRYRLSEMFDQLTLNAQRMDKLYSVLPGLKDNVNIQWYWLEQTGCDNPESCTDYFHGFVITLKSETETIRRESEIDLLKYYTAMYEGTADTEEMDSIIIARKLPLVKVCDTIVVRKVNKRNRMARIKGWDQDDKSKLARYLRTELSDSGIYQLNLVLNKKSKLELANPEEPLHKTSKILTLLNENLSISAATYNGKKINTDVTVNIDINSKEVKVNTVQQPILPDDQPFDLETFLYTETRKVQCEFVDTSYKGPILLNYTSTTPDLIFKVFDRNKQWKNCLVATDVTGSMYPYLAQFQLWHKLHMMANSGNHDFVFFNDGNNMPDHLKITGHVGGVYYVNADNYEELSGTLNESMRNGGGGDGPENNIEAVLKGLDKNRDCKEVIMIADNWATPRDLSMLDKVKVPIRLVLCGTQFGGINTAYLDMIRKNGGSIHTIEKDLLNMGSILEGQSIELEGKTYVLKNGKFVPKASFTAITGG